MSLSIQVIDYELGVIALSDSEIKFVLLLLAVSGFLTYLALEKFRLARWRTSIPLRIAISGIRGKSSVVRMLASALRENGWNVLAKTTGSEAMYILPDGSESRVRRCGVVSILEQKSLLKKAASLGVDCLVAEVMSIHRENHFVESQRILKPTIVGITNVRPDHTNALGETEGQIAEALSLDIPEQAIVFIPENEIRPAFAAAVANKRGQLISVPTGASMSIDLPDRIFSENIDLVAAIACHLDAPVPVIRQGILKTKYDRGQVAVWKYLSSGGRKMVYCANGFAANEPKSTLQILRLVKGRLPQSMDKIVGLLSLRSDRADRSDQWLRALRETGPGFKRLYVIGAHAHIFRWNIDGAEILRGKDPRQLTETLISAVDSDSVIFGFGNFKGIGQALVEHWQQNGEDYGL
ncbi:MAG: poly-gamma-glutamate synthase PgsB [Candidatus Zhuqueibacterota bacterium]